MAEVKSIPAMAPVKPLPKEHQPPSRQRREQAQKDPRDGHDDTSDPDHRTGGNIDDYA